MTLSIFQFLIDETKQEVEKIFNNISINGEKVYLEPDRSDLSKFH